MEINKQVPVPKRKIRDSRSKVRTRCVMEMCKPIPQGGIDWSVQGGMRFG